MRIDFTGLSRFPDDRVVPGNPSTEWYDRFSRGFHGGIRGAPKVDGVGAAVRIGICGCFLVRIGTRAGRVARRTRRAVALAAAAWLAVSAAAAGAYSSIWSLDNPVNDARLMDKTLRELGFGVAVETDANLDAMKAAVRDFGRRLRAAGDVAVGLFFYAGQGAGSGGQNYLIPVDASIEKVDREEDASLESEAIRVQDVLGRMKDAGRGLNIVVTDAVDDPFPIDTPKGSLIAYSAGPGQAALDGPGESSPYTAALAEAMLRRPGLELRDIFRSVGKAVLARTGNRQSPWWRASSLPDEWYFRAPAAGGGGPEVSGIERDFQDSIKDSRSPADFEAYIERSGECRISATKACIKLGELGGEGDKLTLGKRFRDCPECPEMVVVPAGEFMMGSPGSELRRGGNEDPVHRVRIERPFAVGVYEVTRGEYSRFVSATGHSSGDSCWTYEGDAWDWHSGRDWRSPGYRQTDAHPVVCVDWEDGKAYVRWLSEETGEGYRLLSESEWEYVARGGTETARYWGESEWGQCVYANGADASVGRGVGCNDGYARTAPVGSFGGNGFGLHDVLGNVWEWVEDCWHDGYRGAPADGSAWETGDCSRRVLRGCSWDDYPGDLRSAFRFGYVSGLRSNAVGFRIARTLTP